MAPVTAPASLLRRAGLPVAWGTVAFVHSQGAAAPGWCAAVAMAAGVVLGVLLLAGDDTRWAGLLAAAFLLATNPVLQKLWVPPREEAPWDRLVFLKTLVVVGGLLLLAQLGSGGRDGLPLSPPGPSPR